MAVPTSQRLRRPIPGYCLPSCLRSRFPPLAAGGARTVSLERSSRQARTAVSARWFVLRERAGWAEGILRERSIGARTRGGAVTPGRAARCEARERFSGARANSVPRPALLGTIGHDGRLACAPANEPTLDSEAGPGRGQVWLERLGPRLGAEAISLRTPRGPCSEGSAGKARYRGVPGRPSHRGSPSRRARGRAGPPGSHHARRLRSLAPCTAR